MAEFFVEYKIPNGPITKPKSIIVIDCPKIINCVTLDLHDRSLTSVGYLERLAYFTLHSEFTAPHTIMESNVEMMKHAPAGRSLSWEAIRHPETGRLTVVGAVALNTSGFNLGLLSKDADL